MRITAIAIMFGLLLFQNCSGNAPSKNGSKPINHQQWSGLLQKHVHENGLVNYKGFMADSLVLNDYLQKLSKTPPDEKTWSKEEQIAYWINVYNAYTIKLIIDHYPLQSIKDIGSSIQIPFVNSPWDIKFIEINGEKLDLNNIEHGILRKNFNEPRIHFAINCASISCPKLRREAFTGESLEAQLQEQAIDFINDESRNQICKDKVQVSKLFDWFKGDFTKKGELRAFLNQYSKTKIKEGMEIGYLDYDWSLNEVK